VGYALLDETAKRREWIHFFAAINKGGRAVTLRCWAWGDDEAMAMAHLNTVFGAIHSCLHWISNAVKSRG
jgi:hypothetical protein